MTTALDLTYANRQLQYSEGIRRAQESDRYYRLFELFRLMLPLQRDRLLGDRETIPQAAMREAKEALALLDLELPEHMKVHVK